MISGRCHCGDVGFVLKSEPEWLMICNCSLCRRIGGVWAAAEVGDVEITCADGALNSYRQGDETLAMQSCRRCGCTTHYLPTDAAVTRMKVNLAMADPSELARFRVRRFDGADSWSFLD